VIVVWRLTLKHVRANENDGLDSVSTGPDGSKSKAMFRCPIRTAPIYCVAL
jgi:hypothetical protein